MFHCALRCVPCVCSMLLPYLLAGLTAEVAADYRAATYMIVGQLAARAAFTADLATGAGRRRCDEPCGAASPPPLAHTCHCCCRVPNDDNTL